MNLINNGMHSFKCALESLKNLDDNSFKYNANRQEDFLEYNIKDIILRLHHSFEVLFKYMLKEKDEAYIYDKVDEYYKKKFDFVLNQYNKSNYKENVKKNNKKNNKKESKGLSTINYSKAFQRVVIYYDVKLSESTANNIDRLNDLRNNLTHASINFKFDEIKRILANIIIDVIPILENIPEFKEYIDSNNIGEYINKLEFFRNELIFESLEKLILREELAYFKKNDELKTVITKEDFNLINNIDNEYLEFIGYRKCFENMDKYEIINNYDVDELNEQTISLIMNEIKDAFYRLDKEYILDKYNKNCYYYNKLFVLTIHKYFDNISKYINNYNFEEHNLIDIIKKQDFLTKIKISCKLYDLDFFINDVLNNIIGKNIAKTILDEDNIYKLIKEIQNLLNEENIFLFDEDIVDKNLKTKFYNYVNLDIEQEVWAYMCDSRLAGSWGGNGTVDNIEEIYGDDIKVVVLNDKHKVTKFIQEISVYTSYYFDGEYYSNEESISLYIFVDVEDNEIVDFEIHKFY